MKKHPLWKKRLKYLAKDVEMIGVAGSITVMLSLVLAIPALGLALLFDWHIGWSALGALGAGFVSTIGIAIGDVLYSKKSEYDKSILEKEANQKRARLYQQQEANRLLTEKRQAGCNRLKEAIHGLPDKETDVIKQTKRLLEKIEHVVHTYELNKEEDHYVLYTLPNDVASTLSLFGQMNRENRDSMRENLMLVMQDKNEHLECHFIAKHENSRVKAFEHQLTVTKRRTAE